MPGPPLDRDLQPPLPGNRGDHSQWLRRPLEQRALLDVQFDVSGRRRENRRAPGPRRAGRTHRRGLRRTSAPSSPTRPVDCVIRRQPRKGGTSQAAERKPAALFPGPSDDFERPARRRAARRDALERFEPAGDAVGAVVRSARLDRVEVRPALDRRPVRTTLQAQRRRCRRGLARRRSPPHGPSPRSAGAPRNQPA